MIAKDKKEYEFNKIFIEKPAAKELEFLHL